MKITFLGTSGSTPTKDRGLSSLALEYGKDLLLFDCGEGTQMQMMKFGLNISKIRAIFLTHIHGDHVIGLAGLVRTLSLNGRSEDLEIFIPRSDVKNIKSLLKFDRARLSFNVTVKPTKNGEIFKADDYTIDGFKLKHSVETFGYVFTEYDKIHFIKEKCNRLGIKGTMFAQLEEKGAIKVNGKKIKIQDVTTEEEGKIIVYATDSRPIKNTINVSREADILIHEATYADELEDYAEERGHSTSMEAAEIAKKAKAKMLILTHISARYRDTTELLNQAKRIFPNTVIANDGFSLKL